MLALAGLAGFASLPDQDSSWSGGGADEFKGRVTRVIDGDTFWIDSKDVRIRVWGLDAPEVDTALGPSATAALSGLVLGQQLSCEQHDVDRYGRIVVQCFLPDGRDIAAAMIEIGAAKEFCRYPDDHYGTC